MFRDALTRISSHRPPPRAYGLRATFLLTIVNPLTVIAFSAFSSQLLMSSGLLEAIAMALSVFLGSLLVQTVLALFASYLGKYVSNPIIVKTLNMLSGVGIAGFGLVGIAT